MLRLRWLIDVDNVVVGDDTLRVRFYVFEGYLDAVPAVIEWPDRLIVKVRFYLDILQSTALVKYFVHPFLMAEIIDKLYHVCFCFDFGLNSCASVAHDICLNHEVKSVARIVETVCNGSFLGAFHDNARRLVWSDIGHEIHQSHVGVSEIEAFVTPVW